MSRRFWPYGPKWAVWIFWAVYGTSAALAGDTVTGAAIGGCGVLMLALTARRSAAHRRSPEARAKAALEALARQRVREGAWLDRDAHVLLAVQREGRFIFRRWVITRADADQAAEVMETGRAAVTAEVFVLAPPLEKTVRHTAGAMLSMGGDIDMVSAPGGRLAVLARTLKAHRRGLLSPAAAELEELRGQLEASEYIAEPEAGREPEC